MPPCILEAVDVVLEVVLYTMEVVNGLRCVLWVMLCMLFCVLFCMLLRILEAAEGELCLLELPERYRR